MPKAQAQVEFKPSGAMRGVHPCQCQKPSLVAAHQSVAPLVLGS